MRTSTSCHCKPFDQVAWYRSRLERGRKIDDIYANAASLGIELSFEDMIEVWPSEPDPNDDDPDFTKEDLYTEDEGEL